MGRPRKPYFRESDGWWVSRFNGAYEKLAKGRENKTEAERRFHELHLLEIANPSLDARHQTVASVIDRYLAHAREECSPDAFYQRHHYLQLFAEAHGWRKVTDEDCKPLHLDDWILNSPRFKSPSTKAHVATIVLRAFNWAVKKRVLLANPFRGAKRYRGKRRRPLSDQEFQALLRSSSVWKTRQRMTKERPSDCKRRKRPSPGARFRELLVFLRYTGARPGEASHLQWTDINLDGAVIVLEEHKASHLQREPKPRVIPLHPVVVKLLIHIRKRLEAGGHVFHTQRGTPWNRRSLSTRIQRARERAAIPEDAKLYGLRHGFGTRSILNGVDIKTLSELMGHTTCRTTEHYLHLAGQRAHLADAMRKANGRRQGV